MYTGLCPPFPPFRLVFSRDKRLLVRSAVMGFQLRRRDRGAGSRNKRRGLISFSVVEPGVVNLDFYTKYDSSKIKNLRPGNNASASIVKSGLFISTQTQHLKPQQANLLRQLSRRYNVGRLLISPWILLAYCYDNVPGPLASRSTGLYSCPMYVSPSTCIYAVLTLASLHFQTIPQRILLVPYSPS